MRTETPSHEAVPSFRLGTGYWSELPTLHFQAHLGDTVQRAKQILTFGFLLMRCPECGASRVFWFLVRPGQIDFYEGHSVNDYGRLSKLNLMRMRDEFFNGGHHLSTVYDEHWTN